MDSDKASLFLRDRLLFACLFGSRAHGTENEASDIDVRGVFAPRGDDLLMPGFPESIEAEGDSVFHEFRKFVSMVVSSNPNILEVLWAPPHARLHVHPAWEAMDAARPRLLSRRAASTYAGWCKAEVSRMERLEERARAGDAEAARRHRKAAAHALRLMRVAREALVEGELRVLRADARDILDVKEGRRAVGDAMAEAVSIARELRLLRDASPLPEEVDADFVRKLTRDVLRDFAGSPPLAPRGLLSELSGIGNPPPKTLLSALEGRVVCLDFEGSGFSGQGLADVVEVGAVEVVRGRETGALFRSLVRPDRRPNSWARRIHGLSWSDLREAPRFGEVWPSLKAFIGDSPVVAHGARSDMAMLEGELKAAGLASYPLEFHCTAHLARRLMGGKNEVSLDAAATAFAVQGRGGRRHGALEDARLVARLLPVLASVARERGVDARPIRDEPKPLKWVYREDSGGLLATNGRVTVRASPPPHPENTHAVRIDAKKGRIVVFEISTGAQGNPDGPSVVFHHKATGEFRSAAPGAAPAFIKGRGEAGSPRPGPQ